MLRPSVSDSKKRGQEAAGCKTAKRHDSETNKDEKMTEGSRMLMSRQLSAFQRLTKKRGQEIAEHSWQGSGQRLAKKEMLEGYDPESTTCMSLQAIPSLAALADHHCAYCPLSL